MQEQAPDADTEEWQILSLRHINQHLLDLGFKECSPGVLQLLLISIISRADLVLPSLGSIDAADFFLNVHH